MATTLERPTAPARGHRRRRHVLIALVVGTSVIIAGLELNGRVLRYDQVGYNGSGSRMGAPTSTPTPADAYTLHTFGSGDEAVYRYRPDGDVEYGFDITNYGDQTVTVRALPPHRTQYADLTGVYIGNGSLNERHGGSPEAVIPFRPFVLKPGEIRWVELHYRFASCPLPPGAAGVPPGQPLNLGWQGWRSETVSFTVHGISRSHTFKLPQFVVLDGVVPCPEHEARQRQRFAEGRPDWVDEHAVGVRGVKP